MTRGGAGGSGGAISGAWLAFASTSERKWEKLASEESVAVAVSGVEKGTKHNAVAANKTCASKDQVSHAMSNGILMNTPVRTLWQVSEIAPCSAQVRCL